MSEVHPETMLGEGTSRSNNIQMNGSAAGRHGCTIICSPGSQSAMGWIRSRPSSKPTYVTDAGCRSGKTASPWLIYGGWHSRSVSFSGVGPFFFSHLRLVLSLGGAGGDSWKTSSRTAEIVIITHLCTAGDTRLAFKTSDFSPFPDLWIKTADA